MSCFDLAVTMKTTHDVLLMCPDCHRKSNISYQKVRQKLAVQCNAPFAARTIRNPRLYEIRSISRQLYYLKDETPENEQIELKSRLLELCPDVEEVSDDLLREYVDIRVTSVSLCSK